MRERGLSTGAIVGVVVAVVVVVVVGVVAAVFLIGPGSKVEIAFTPSTLHVGDSYT